MSKRTYFRINRTNTSNKYLKNFKLISLSAMALLLVTAGIGFGPLGKNQIHADSMTSTINPWWPAAGVSISGSQTFKGALNNWDINNYEMYWSVDGGSLSTMPSNYNGYPHKETSVNVSTWNWSNDGTYTVKYIAKNKKGTEIDSVSFKITVTHPVESITGAAQPATVTGSQPILSSTTVSTIQPISQVGGAQTTTVPTGLKFYVNPSTPARAQADFWRTSRPTDASQIDKIANNPAATWFGDWNTNVQADVDAYVAAAAASSAVPTLVAYNIPQRDCGSYSAGGAGGGDAYISWITGFARGIGTRSAWVILEPDAAADMSCLSPTDQASRMSLLAQAVTILKANPGTRVYVDAGNPHWQTAATMASRLTASNVAAADGFSLNVSNFFTMADNTTFGQDLSSKVGGKHFVIDTSRNGNGPTADSQWCNPAGRALGARPTSQTGNDKIDAFLWIKGPGESDGACGNGAPSAGVWWPDYALGLASRAAY